MPYKCEKIIIAKTQYDKRIKLSEQNKIDIKKLHEQGIAIREIARRFPVSRRRIQQILFPERIEIQLKAREERGGWIQYYDKNKHAESKKKHRRYKQKLYVDNKITLDSTSEDKNVNEKK